MSETSLSNASASTSEHFNRAAASLKAAERDAQAAIDSAVDGLASAYGDAKPLLSRVGQRARDYASDGYDAARERPPPCATAASRPWNRPAATCRTSRSSRC